MIETLKRKKRLTKQNRISRKLLINHRLGLGISKQYKSLRGYYTKRNRKITTARYDNEGNIIGGGIFDFFRLKLNIRKIKGIIGKLNVLERHISKEIDSYEIEAKQFKIMAEKTAGFQTNYIIAKRRNVILKNYRKDTEEINPRTDKNKIVIIEDEIKKSESDFKQAEKMVVAQFKEVGKDIKHFLYLSAKFEKESKKFLQIDELKKKVEVFQLEIENIRTRAVNAEGLTGIAKADKQAIAKYKKNKEDYDFVLSLSAQNLESIRKLQQKQASFATTMEYYKNQFGTFKREGSTESKGALGAIKITGKLKEWSKLTDQLASSLLGVSDNTRDMITVLEEVKIAITKCVTELVSIPEYINKRANTDAILWFQHDVEDIIKILNEIKKHFKNLKNEFYNQISAENMYSNYNYNSIFLRVIEIRLKFYLWMIEKALSKANRDISREVPDKLSTGGYILFGGASGAPASGASGSGSRPPKKKNYGICNFLETKKPYKTIPIKFLIQNLNLDELKQKPNKTGCYSKEVTQDIFKNCIENIFDRYLLAAFLNDNILASEPPEDLKKGIEIFAQVLNLLKTTTKWDLDTKKQIADIFKKLPAIKPIDDALVNPAANIDKNKKISDLFENNGNKKTLTDTNEEAVQEYLLDSTKPYIKNFIIKILDPKHKDFFYGILEYDNDTTKHIQNTINSAPPAPAPAPPAPATSSAAPAKSSASSSASASATPAPPAPVNNNLLNDVEFEKMTKKIESINEGLSRFSVNPSDDFTEIQNLLNKIYNLIKELKSRISNDKKIFGLNEIKDYLDDIKDRVDTDDVEVDSNDDDIKKMMQDLRLFKSNFDMMSTFYDDIKLKTKEETAKKALDELIDEHLKSNGKESIGTIANRISRDKKYQKSDASPKDKLLNNSITSKSPGAVLQLDKDDKEKEQQKQKEEEKKTDPDPDPDWLKDLDARAKHNKNLISTILLRIPNEFAKQYIEVKELFQFMKEKIYGLIKGENTFAQLSDNFQTMTTTLIDIKAIEADLIEVKVKDEPKVLLGLGDYIPTPLSLEKKSQARDETKKIDTLVKSMMQNTFFEDREAKPTDDASISRIFEKILAGSNAFNIPHIPVSDLMLLQKPNNFNLLIQKFMKSMENLGIKSSMSAEDIKNNAELLKKYCNIKKYIERTVAESVESKEKASKEIKIPGDCNFPKDKQQQKK